MTISTKFNLVLALVFTIVLGVVGYVSNYVLQKNAREEVIRHAEMMMEAALAIRSYTIKEVKPLLSKQLEKEFRKRETRSTAVFNQRYGNLGVLTIPVIIKNLILVNTLF